jgi:Ca2+-binding EF-hand superfamily protein
MRFKCFLVVTGLALLLGPTVGMSQFGGQPGGFGGPPGGFGGQPGGFGGRGAGGQPGAFGGGRGGGMGGFGSMDPNERWNQMTGGKAVWKRSEITDPNTAARFDRIAQMVGATNGEITKDQYTGMMQGFAQRFAQGGGGAPGGAAMAAPGGAQGMPGFGGGQMPGAWSGGGQPGGFGGGGGRNRGWGGGFGGPGGGGGFNLDAIAEYRFRQLDTNGDGLLNYDELAADETLQSELQKWDTNGDRNIDINEFKEYMRARVQQFQAGGQGWNPMQMVEDEADKKPTVYRAGKLPPNIPAWFSRYDTDGDGQIGLYEWKAAGQPIAQFEAMDLNGDGFVTVEEVMRTVVGKSPDSGSPGMGMGGFGGGMPGGFGGFGGGFGGGRGNRGQGGPGGFAMPGGFGGGMPGGFGGGQGGGRNRGPGGFGGDQGGMGGGRNRGPGGFGGGQGGPSADQNGFGGGQGGGRGRGRGNRGGNFPGGEE